MGRLRWKKGPNLVAGLTLWRLLLLHHDRRGGRRQRLEETGMLDQLRNEPIARNDDVVTDRRDLEQLGCKGKGQSDATMRRRIARDDTGVKRGAGPGNPVHPGHRGPAIDVGVVVSLLLEDAEDAQLGSVARHSRRYARGRDERHAPINVDLLLAQGNDEHHGLAIVDVGDRLFRRLIVLSLALLGDGRSRGGHDHEGGGAKPS